jgi:cytidylate kinase
MKAEADAHMLDTTDLTVDQAVAQVLAWWRNTAN